MTFGFDLVKAAPGDSQPPECLGSNPSMTSFFFFGVFFSLPKVMDNLCRCRAICYAAAAFASLHSSFGLLFAGGYRQQP